MNAKELVTQPKQPKTESIDINDFNPSFELVERLRGRPIYITQSTTQFQELAKYYRMRDAGTLPADAIKPMYGQVMIFSDVESLMRGQPDFVHPPEAAPNNEFCGVVPRSDELVVCNYNTLEIHRQGQKIEFKHTLMNDIKFLAFNESGDRLLISSSGTDCLLEFSYPDMRLTWTWFAPEHGYDRAPDGTHVLTTRILETANIEPGDKHRVLDDGTDYSNLDVLTKSQSAHMNSATYIQGGKLIAATVYHTGDALVINRTTGEMVKVMTGLQHPHGFYEFGSDKKYYVITSPTSGQVEFLDANFSHTVTLNGLLKEGLVSERTWLQNTFPIGGDMLAIVDHYNYRIILIDMATKEFFTVPTDPDWKIFEFKVGEKGDNYSNFFSTHEV